MRIVKTLLGEEVLNSVRLNLVDDEEIEEGEIKEIAVIKSVIIPQTRKKFKESSLISRSQDKIDKIDIDRINKQPHTHRVVLPSLQNPAYSKEVQVTTKKLFIPKQIVDKYNAPNLNDNNPNASIIQDNMSRVFKVESPNQQTLRNSPSSNKINSSTNQVLKESVSLKDILSPEVTNDLKQKFIFLKNKPQKWDLNHFRSSFNEKNEISLQSTLDKEINQQSHNLIRYLQGKKEISEITAKKLHDYDEAQMHKLNKICQKLYHNQEDDKVFKEKTDKLLKARARKESGDYKSNLFRMGDDLSKIRSLIESQSPKLNDRERYVDRHNEILKRWEKNNIDKFHHKSRIQRPRFSSVIAIKNINSIVENLNLPKHDSYIESKFTSPASTIK